MRPQELEAHLQMDHGKSETTAKDLVERQQALALFQENSETVGAVSEVQLAMWHLVTVTDENATLKGAVATSTEDELGLVHAISVKRDYRRQGVGGELLEELYQALEADQLEAKVKIGSQANEFFEASGWTQARQTGDGNMNVWQYAVEGSLN